ncbi:BON domain-containing protein [Novosphingobium sp. FGD1]|uniref:BON domain-containing protein n=1 Tax=Novosphingobium silvae TaxID=2692619 RepID=A0A7X4K7T1_9SPHN|nr:BON domain-containing protein [Novosphingobium silvae]MYL98500.1 BON domain-containing protein [Novosphingobium silvae]
MNRRDPNAHSRQAGGYRSDDSSWDSPRQANQWQADAGRQQGSDWDTEDSGRSDYSRQSRSLEGRYVGDPRDESSDRQRGESWGGGERSHRDRGSYGASQGSSYGSSYGESGGYGRGRFRGSEGGYDAHQGRGRAADRGYRFSGEHSSDYHPHDYDASGGNRYGNFTSEEFGGRDFSRNERSGLSGGMSPSNSYRPSYGPGSWSSGRDHDDDSAWRDYGERRGFLQRAGDEVASWFGDEDAARRREADHRGRGPSDYTRSDERIREDVNDVLTHDSRLDASHVRVQVKDGEVTLEGTVDNRLAKRRAEDLADDVSGVRHVQNNLRLSSTGLSSTGLSGTGSRSEGLTAGTSTPGYSHTATSGSSTGASSTGSSQTGSSSIGGTSTSASGSGGTSASSTGTSDTKGVTGG